MQQCVVDEEGVVVRDVECVRARCGVWGGGCSGVTQDLGTHSSPWQSFVSGCVCVCVSVAAILVILDGGQDSVC